MFKAVKKIGKGASKAFNKVKGHVKSSAKDIGKLAKKSAKDVGKHLKKDLLDKGIKFGKKALHSKVGRKLVDVVTDPDAMGNPLMMGLKLGAPKIYDKVNEFKDKGAALAQQFTGMPIADMRNNMKNSIASAKAVVGLPGKKNIEMGDYDNNTKSNYIDFETLPNFEIDDVNSQVSGATNSVAMSNITSSTVTNQENPENPLKNKPKASSDFNPPVNNKKRQTKYKDDSHIPRTTIQLD